MLFLKCFNKLMLPNICDFLLFYLGITQGWMKQLTDGEALSRLGSNL